MRSDIITRLFAATGEAEARRAVDDLTAEELADVLAYLTWVTDRPRRPRGLAVPAGMAVHHLNGDPHDNSPGNVRLVPMRESRRKDAAA